jgi:hypothetical protein
MQDTEKVNEGGFHTEQVLLGCASKHLGLVVGLNVNIVSDMRVLGASMYHATSLCNNVAACVVFRQTGC